MHAPNIYLIPGQGADKRLFNAFDLHLDHNVHHVPYHTPKKGDSMRSFAQQLSTHIDQSKPFILIGTSLGGMLATEMAEILNPEKVILISSAKNRTELPFSYRFQKQIPFYGIIPPSLIKWGAKIAQPLVEPDRNKEKATFKAMLNDKDPYFLSRTIHMIVNWNRLTYS